MKIAVRIALVLVLITASFLGGMWYMSQDPHKKLTAEDRRILHYACPMHPQYISDRTGDCPSCGMRLEPVYADPMLNAQDSAALMPVGTVRISPEHQQLIGLRIGQVEMTGGPHSVRILGRVAVDETRVYRISAALDGWIVDALPNTVGSFVKKNEILGAFYSPEFLGAEQAYIYALNAMDRFQAAQTETKQQVQLTSSNIQQSKDTLKNMGMSDLQETEIARDRRLVQKIYLVAPAAGFVRLRNISPGYRYEKGAELYRIEDLSRVWILADLFEKEADYVQPGLIAQVRSEQNPSRVFQARVSSVLPQFDAATRTLKVRLEVENPDFKLRPDMFVNVEFPVNIPASVTIPMDAVVDTGLRKTVFVDRGNGYLEPREVETGWTFNDRIEITRGLKPGEKIVESGAFLVNSESRLKLAAAGLPEDYVIDPVCGMGVDPRKSGNKKTDYKGQTYYFCSDLCKGKFDKDPGKYSRQEMESVNPEKSVKDLVCGMDVNPSTPGVIKAEYKGKTYYFCSDLCKRKFEVDPGKYLTQQAKNENPQTHSVHSTMSSQP